MFDALIARSVRVAALIANLQTDETPDLFALVAGSVPLR